MDKMMFFASFRPENSFRIEIRKLLEWVKHLVTQHLYRFADFELIVDKSALRRGDTLVSMTPKMFDMLVVLVSNHGDIVDKEKLLEEVWPDSFVEEGNIAYNIRQLRKLLGDDAQSPVFIETVPRRGYRFIAPVEEVRETPPAPAIHGNGTENLHRRFATPEPVPVKSSFHPFTPILVVFVCVVAVGLLYFILNRTAASLPVLSRPFESERLSASGGVYGAAVSPDGKTVVYSLRLGEKQGLWRREIDSSNNVPLIPATTESYYDLAFAPDGTSIYFSRAPNEIETPDLYRVPILGGIPDKVITGSGGAFTGSFSVSPDGSRISFVRCPRTAEEWCSIWIADARDGRNERKIVNRLDPDRIGDLEFSPDGRKIVFAAGQSRNASNEFQLFEFDLGSNTERGFTAETFFNIKNLAWLPDQSGLLITASRVPNRQFRVWHVGAGTGSAEPLTKDSEVYSVISLDLEGRNLVSTQVTEDFGIYLFDIGDTSRKRLVAKGFRGIFTPDGKLYFASTMSGNDEIWTTNLDGTSQRQLTNDPGGDGTPVASPDGKTLFFASNRGGKAHVWRMSLDGSDQRQVTAETGSPVAVSPDGKTLYFQHALHGNLWSVSLATGEEKLAFDHARGRFAVTPDASTAAIRSDTPNGQELSIVSLASGQTIRTFPFAKERSRVLSFAWMPDGRSLMYLVTDPRYENGAIYQLPLAGGTPRQIADLKNEQLSEIANIAISPDGRSYTVVLGNWKHDAVLIRGLR